MMDHPNIAKVLDGGATDTGRPFFVMELVRGIPITRYCDENHLTPTSRLELFIKACHAVQHAHEKAIIHRDLKPANILVTLHDGVPVPKVIDFGIAKATQGRLTDATLFTAFEQFIGTPVYMSPEQAEMSGLDIDTRSDIYSLGVLLYELLTGQPPFDPKSFASAGVDEIRHPIREDEPPKPSTRLRTLGEVERTTVARHRSTALAQLSLLLRGDLDWVVMKCLEKDRTRRYDTANALIADMEQ
jgi:serine/threonine protein kinase